MGWRIETALGDQRAADDYADRLVELFPESREAEQFKGG